METSEIAVKALEILDQDGWCKGSVSFHSQAMDNVHVVVAGEPPLQPQGYREGSHCLAGAWSMAATGNPAIWRNQAMFEPLVKAILALYPEIGDLPWFGVPFEFSTLADVNTSVITYLNDRQETTEDDVRAVLEKLAAG